MTQTNNLSEQREQIKKEVESRIEANRLRLNYNEADYGYKVSKHTAEWVRIYKQVQKIWGDISDIVETEAGNYVDEIMEKEFAPHLSELLDAILLKGIAGSIQDTLGISDDKTLI